MKHESHRRRGTGYQPVSAPKNHGLVARATHSAVTAHSGREHVPFLRAHLRRAIDLIKHRLGEVSVVLVGEQSMSRLHEQFMGLAGPTDVMSFPLEVDRRGRVISGEVIVCVPVARREAKRRKIPLRHELLLYALHGLLHLSGFDDRTDSEYRKMHREEDRILTKLGIGPTFDPHCGAGVPPAANVKMQAGRPHRNKKGAAC